LILVEVREESTLIEAHHELAGTKVESSRPTLNIKLSTPWSKVVPSHLGSKVEPCQSW